MTSDYVFKTQPYEHQREAFMLSRSKKNFAFLMEMGCVDATTEYLSPTGWRRIDEYAGGEVAQYTVDGRAEFVTPTAYHKKPCPDKMLRITSSRGCDQLLSQDHRVLFHDYNGGTHELPALELAEKHWSLARGIKARIPASFTLTAPGKLSLTNEEIRLQVAVHADGHFPKATVNRRCYIRLKKQRKKDRMRELLLDAGAPFDEKNIADGFTLFTFNAPHRSKVYDVSWYKASLEQRKIIAQEAAYWDGSHVHSGGERFFSRELSSAEFIQYCYVSTDRRASISTVHRDDGIDYVVHAIGTGRTGNYVMPRDIVYEASPDGYMYCFTVPSSFLVFRRNGCVFASGNTGKSKVVIDTAAFQYNAGEINCLLVIAPNGVHRNWITDEVPVHLPDYIDRVSACWVATQRKADKQALERLFTADAHKMRIVAVNIDAMSTKRGKVFVRKLLNTFNVLMCVDESDDIKTPGASRTMSTIALGKYAKMRRICTGTAISQGPFDLYAQYAFLSRQITGFTTAASFRAHFGEYERIELQAGKNKAPGDRLTPGKDYYDNLTQYRNLDQLTALIAPYSYRKLKADCLDLPEKIYAPNYPVKMGKEQRRLYDEAMSATVVYLQQQDALDGGLFDPMMSEADLLDHIMNLGTKTKIENALTRLLRAQQIIGGYFTDEDGTVHAIDPDTNKGTGNTRIKALMQVVSEIQSPVIIWARFIPEIEAIRDELARVYGKDAVVTYYGANTPEERVEAKERFQGERKSINRAGEHVVEVIPEDQRANFFVGNAAAGGRGLTLTRAQYMIYYSNSFSLLHRQQSEDRAHRIGQHENVTYIDMEATGTIDGHIRKSLHKKQQVADQVLGPLSDINYGEGDV